MGLFIDLDLVPVRTPFFMNVGFFLLIKLKMSNHLYKRSCFESKTSILQFCLDLTTQELKCVFCIVCGPLHAVIRGSKLEHN